MKNKHSKKQIIDGGGCIDSNMRGDNVGPDLTPAIRSKLLKEIQAFDEKATTDLIERESVGGHSVNAYENWLEGSGDEPVEANPDMLTEDEFVSLAKPDKDEELEDAKSEVDEVLSHRQRQVWRLCMRQGYSETQAADFLHISRNTVNKYLAEATRKVKEHFDARKD